MKTTHNINLNGQVFCIDDDACRKLQSYIETLEDFYLKEEGGQEIMNDIESRIAELFNESLQKNHKQVINIADIDHIISIMGSPDAIIDEETGTEKTPKGRSSKTNRKLYRDIDNRVLGGVAAGIAANLDISVVYVRILFIVLLFAGSLAFWVYIILWICVPGAATAKEKLEMKGEKINVSNIEKNIRKTYDNIKKKSRLRSTLDEISGSVGNITEQLVKILKKLCSFFLMIISVVGLLGGTFVFLLVNYTIIFFASRTFELEDRPFALISPFFSSFTSSLIPWIVLCIPALLVIYLSAYYLIRFRFRKTIVLIALGVWFISCIIGIFWVIGQNLDFSEKEQVTEVIPIVPVDSSRQCIHLNLNHTPAKSFRFLRSHNYFKIIKNKDYQSPELCTPGGFRIKGLTSGDAPRLGIKKTARGYTESEAIATANGITPNWRLSNDTLYIDKFLTTTMKEWRCQEVDFVLYLPEGYHINFINATPRNAAKGYIFCDPSNHTEDIARRYIMECDSLRQIR